MLWGDYMGNSKLRMLYAVRNRETKEIIKATKCKGGSFYMIRSMCQKRCDEMNGAHKMVNINASEYEVGEYAVIDIEEYKELIRRI